MAKKKTGKIIQMLSPENYIRQRGRSLPIHECLITENWNEDKKASVIISRKHSNGNYTMGFYLVDLGCLGIKDALFKFNINEIEYQEFLEQMNNQTELEQISYTLAHNIIFAALEYADELGFKPVKDFTQTMQYFLEEDNDEVELIEIECGYNGKPMYVRGPYDSEAEAKRIMLHLEKTVGPGNFLFVDDASDLTFDQEEEHEFMEVIKNMIDKSSRGLQLLIQLEHVNSPSVWRRIVVPEHYTFDFLHVIIQFCFGWEDAHLYQFNPKGKKPYPIIKEMDKEDDPDRTIEASSILLADIFKEEGQQFSYLYDYGDNWAHNIQLEKIQTTLINLPACIDGEGACPPEDCGGHPGYEMLKKILSDPKHPEHEEYRNWLGLDANEQWDVNKFDLNLAHVLLKAYFSIDSL